MARFLCGKILLIGDLKPQNLAKYPGVTSFSDCLSDCQAILTRFSKIIFKLNNSVSFHGF